ncbi:MAG: hypothetical protein MPJ24_11840 [Pirellulaceae bacterium]|nr:hypothetical protein [Pirellulaceae bacterium]
MVDNFPTQFDEVIKRLRRQVTGTPERSDPSNFFDAICVMAELDKKTPDIELVWESILSDIIDLNNHIEDFLKDANALWRCSCDILSCVNNCQTYILNKSNVNRSEVYDLCWRISRAWELLLHGDAEDEDFEMSIYMEIPRDQEEIL